MVTRTRPEATEDPYAVFGELNWIAWKEPVGEGAKRVSAATVVLWAGLVSLPLITVALLLTSERNESKLPEPTSAGGALEEITLDAARAQGDELLSLSERPHGDGPFLESNRH